MNSFLAIFSLFTPLPAQAVCPVCVVAVGAGFGLSQYFGIDDAITGVWLGGGLIALSMWTAGWLEKKKVKYNLGLAISILAYYGLSAWPLVSKGFIGHLDNRIWGIDKIIFGLILGSLILPAANYWYQSMKTKNNGHAHFPFEKVAIPLAGLILGSLLVYLIG
jgi:hypothetical protein